MGAADDEAHALLADMEGTAGADAAVAYVRQRRRDSGEPSMSKTAAVTTANRFLRDSEEEATATADRAYPNAFQDLWIIDPARPDDSGVPRCGDSVLAVTADDEVYSINPWHGEEMIGMARPPSDEDAWTLPESWDDALHEVRQQASWQSLMTFVDDQREQEDVFPPSEHMMRALELTPFDEVKVVILGQDPYHRRGQAHGLAFSVEQEKLPPSLRKIRQALTDEGIAPPPGGNLEGWARQGVLLLNTVLTVGEGAAGSHRGKGWEEFTDGVIRALNEKPERVVFLLWGQDAHRKERMITNPKHTVIKAAHPAARASAKNPLDGSGAFSKADEALEEAGRTPINWSSGPADV